MTNERLIASVKTLREPQRDKVRIINFDEVKPLRLKNRTIE